MEVSVEMKTVASDWHVYSKIVWQRSRKGEKLIAEKEKTQGSNRYRSVRCCLDVEKEE